MGPGWTLRALRAGRLPSLPHGRVEVAEIARRFPAGESTTFLGAGATERSFKTALGGSKHRFVHIAAHGLIDSAHPEFSGVVLAPEGNEEDGLLELFEIYGLPLEGVTLTVLSACQTALGRWVGGEGVVGLVRGFLGAGSRNVVASHWSVSDESTSLLMRRFYEEILTGSGIPEALRKAQLAMARGRLGDGRNTQPFYWAPFSVYGAGTK